MTLPMIGNQALLVHLFMAVAGDHPVRDHAYLRQAWQACGEGGLGLDSPIATTGLPVAPTEWDPAKWPSGAMVAVRARRGRGVQQAMLRREHDTVCLTVMREPGDGSTWADLAREWSSTMAAPPPGLIGVARIFTARLTDPGVTPSPGSELSDAVRAGWPEQFRAEEWPQGVRTPEGFAVWEVPAQPDDRVERQIAVIAAGADDARLSAWAWIRGDRTLPPFTRYLMHAAKLRYQLRVWTGGQSFRERRQEANETVNELLKLTQSPVRHGQLEDAKLLAVAEVLTTLQADHLGLILTSSRLREMRRTVQIAVSNMAQLPAAEPNQGLFGDDRELGAWFAQQLDDDAVYLDAAQERAGVLGRHIDQRVQRSRQRRQERLNLGLTAVIGTIASSLTTIQLLNYTLPLPAHLKPGLVASLGALSLYVFLLVLRRALPQPTWPRLLTHGGFALLVSALVWVGVLAARGPAVGIGWIWACLGAGSVAGLGLALVSKLRQRPSQASGGQVSMRQRLRWAITARRRVDQMLDAMEAAGTAPTQENIADALAGARFILTNAPDGDHRLGMIVHLLGSLVQIRFYQIRDAGELDEAISLLRGALERFPLYDSRRAQYETDQHAYQQLAEAIRRRTGALPATTREALETIERALDVLPGTAGSAPHRLLAALATALELRYARSGDFTAGDIDEAIERWRDSLTRMPEHHPDHPIHRSRLARAISLRADVTGQPDADAYAIEPDQLYLDAAASTWRKALGASSDSDLERAIRLSRRAAVAVDHIDPDFAPQFLTVFGSLLLNYYEYCRDGSVLDEAEKVFEWSSKLSSVHDQTVYLHGLGRINQLKFEHSQSIEHLRKSVKYLRQAEARKPTDDPMHFTYLFNLGVILKTWAKETGEPHDEAVQLLERASGACPDTHPRKPIYLSTLAELRLAQWRASGDTEDLNEAVGAARAAVGFAQGDHRDRVGCSSMLAQVLSERYQNSPSDSRQMAEIDEAIELLRWAVSAASGWQRIMELANLGVAYVRRYESLRTESDRASAVAAFREVARSENASPSKRADTAREWGFLEASVEHWSEAVAAYELAIELLVEAVPPTIARPDQERLLGARFGLAMDAAACCLHLKNPKQAVELLEQGRGVLLGREFDLRSDITQLVERHPRLAERFVRSQQSLATIGAPGAPTDQIDFAEMTDFDGERRTAAFISLADSGSRRSRSHDLSEGESVWHEHQLLLAEIRCLDGFDRFLLRPPASELVAAAAQGPIVILNVSQFRSDAIILDPSLNDDGVAVVPLPAVSHSPPAVVEAAAEDGGKDDADDRVLREILGWLWTNIAAPVLGRLTLSPQTDPACRSARLWWCPTDWLSFVPVHAASDYEHDKVLGVSDYVVSSYTPTIRALLRARENVKKSTFRRRESHIPAIISMPSTPGEADLPGAGRLARIVKSLTPGCVVLEGPDAHYETVGNLLETARWMLFACHAEGDEREPSAGRLLLYDHQDRPLTVRDISALNLAGAEFAYLSACATATGLRRALADESIHLAAAFQVAGFPQVIGTLWPVQEYPAMRIAHEFFTALAENPDPSRTAQYLHDAVRKYRRDREHRPDLWAAFIHTGA